MKNRDYKQFVAGHYYHVYNRGNAKMDIYLDESDYIFFLSRIKEYLFPATQRMPLKVLRGASSTYRRKELPPESFSVAAYVLMPNHFHLLIRQNSDIPISKLLSKLCTSYSMYFNKKYGRVGGVFQDQFKAVLVESDDQFRWVIEYIHENPVKSSLVKSRNEYSWTSLNDVMGLCTRMPL